MIMADSSVWIDYFRNLSRSHVELLDSALEHDEVVLGDLILTEVQQGISRRKDFDLIRFVFDQMECRTLGGWNVAMDASDNYQFLRKKGIQVRRTIDMIIGTYCIRNDIWLIHNDRDFEPMEKYLGLKVLR
jgi:predicted nucleic acid-binding protein